MSYNVNAVIDSGAVSTVISRKFYNKLRTKGYINKSKKSSKKFVSATSKLINNFGEIETSLTIGSYKLENCNIAVLDISNDILIGHDTIERLVGESKGLAIRKREGHNQGIFLEFLDEDGKCEEELSLDKTDPIPQRLLPVRRIISTKKDPNGWQVFSTDKIKIEPGLSSPATLRIEAVDGLPSNKKRFLAMEPEMGEIGSENFLTKCFDTKKGDKIIDVVIKNANAKPLEISEDTKIGTLFNATEAKLGRLMQKDISDIKNFNEIVSKQIPAKVNLDNAGVIDVAYDFEPINHVNPGDLIAGNHEQLALPDVSDDKEDDSNTETNFQFFSISHTSHQDNVQRDFKIKHGFKDPCLAEKLKEHCQSVSRLFNIDDNYFPAVQGYKATLNCPDGVTLKNIPCSKNPPSHHSALMRMITTMCKRGIFEESNSPFSCKLWRV